MSSTGAVFELTRTNRIDNNTYGTLLLYDVVNDIVGSKPILKYITYECGELIDTGIYQLRFVSFAKNKPAFRIIKETNFPYFACTSIGYLIPSYVDVTHKYVSGLMVSCIYFGTKLSVITNCTFIPNEKAENEIFRNTIEKLNNEAVILLVVR